LPNQLRMILKIFTKKIYINLILLLTIFTLDRISKIFVINFSGNSNAVELYTSKFLNISLVWNEGIAFGLFSFQRSYLYNSITLFICLVILIVFMMMIKSNELKQYPLVMILGGALSNLFDRIFYKAVPDFIDFHINSLHWFIFNIADIFITLGVFSMILIEFFGKNKNIYEND
jgi:signal peptidase II